MYGVFTYIWIIFRVNVGKYSIHGAYGYENPRTGFANPQTIKALKISGGLNLEDLERWGFLKDHFCGEDR